MSRIRLLGTTIQETKDALTATRQGDGTDVSSDRTKTIIRALVTLAFVGLSFYLFRRNGPEDHKEAAIIVGFLGGYWLR